ncbi:nitrogenase component 1 [Anaerosporobacter sp.]|uniref:nitrogenase component 1 n=1 Tax=Anaerosporobacter sp. TaxID=1872529 RepID=UPI00286F2D7A|nr:nitrogenase component 1 [Anaerosporobacter sp.]
MGILDERKLIAREKRNSTITAYYGPTENLREDLEVTDIRQRIRTFSQTAADELTVALNLLSTIKDIAVVIHGAIGCSAAMLGNEFQNRKQVEIDDTFTWYSTNLNERDTIMGGDEKLRATVERAYHENKPKAIFVVGTAVVAINNDDITSVILELQDELEIPIIQINTDGFKSKAGINGSDIVLHGIGKYLIANREDVSDNLVTIVGTTLSRQTKKETEQVLEQLGLQANVIPRYASVDEIRNTSKSVATIALNNEEAEVLLQGLGERGIPEIKAQAPIGTNAISKWLSQLGKQLSIQEKVEAFIKEEEKKVQSYIAKQPLKGERVYINLPASLAGSVVELVEELGGEVVGITIPFVDEGNKENLKHWKKSLYVQVGEGQLFELANIFAKNQVTYYISEQAKGSFGAKQGVIPIPIGNKNIFFYQGIKTFVESLTRAKRSVSYTNYIKDGSKKVYTDGWTKKSTNWYIKQEVK